MSLYFNDDTDIEDKITQEREFSGSKLRMLRKRDHQTLKEISGLCGMSESHLSKIEKGKEDINVAQIAVLADHYDVVAETFFHENGAIPGEIFYKLFVAADVEPYKDNILMQFKSLTDKAVERGNGKTLLDMIYTMMKVCSESDDPWMDSFREIDLARGKDVTSELIKEK